MGKKSRRPGKNNKKVPPQYRIDLRVLLPPIDLPLPLGNPGTPTDFTDARAMADYMFQNFLCFKRDKYNEKRYAMLHGYFRFLLLDKETWNDKDVTRMKEIAFKKSEPVLFRIEALLILSHLHCDHMKCNLEEGTLYREEIINLCNNASEDEKSISVVFYDKNPSRIVRSSAGDIMLKRRKIVEETLRKEAGRKVTVVSLVSNEIRDVPRIAAGCCDNCAKSKEELGIKSLSCCQTCGLAFYCSRTCQTNDWRFHKKYCRAEGDFRPNDQAIEIRSRQQVVLVEKVNTRATSKSKDGHDAWVVTDINKASKRVISQLHLRRLRPALWQIVLSQTERKRLGQLVKKQMQLENQVAENEREIAKHKQTLNELRKKIEQEQQKMEMAAKEVEQARKKFEEMHRIEFAVKLIFLHEELLTRFNPQRNEVRRHSI
jgi:hypothetical protein